jgi:hypothetical protein
VTRSAQNEGLSVTALPVAHGDALWVEYGDASNRHQLLIDGGPAGTYRVVHDWLAKLPPEKRTLDLFVVTHIDADHIDGAIILLQELGQLGVTVNEVWFNGWKHLSDESSPVDVFAPAQGEFLGGLIDKDGLRWNVSFDSGPAAVPESGLLPHITLDGGALVTLLSPQPRQLRRLRRNWQSVALDAGWKPGDSTAALERLAKRRDYQPPTPQDVFGDVFATDNSVANGSSIAFVLEHDGKSCLFAADALPEVLVEGLRRFAAERSAEAVQFDLVKVAHHGSAKNIDEELVRNMPTRRYLISTNGARYHHPDRAAIGLILDQHQGDGCELYFNYESDMTREWADPATQKRRDYRAVFPPPGSAGITVKVVD